jgi:phosphoglycerate dehydrogenase-like enzyme
VSAPAEEAALARLVRTAQARHVIVGGKPYRDALYASLPRGGVIARFGVGFDGVDFTKATSAGLFVTNTPGQLTPSVAEHTMSLILAAARHVPAFDREVHDGVWSPRPGIELQGKTLAIVGMGHIGRAVARIAIAGFQMRVVGCQRRPPVPIDHPDFVPGIAAITADVAEAVRDADFVSLHLATNASTAGFLNEQRMAMLSPKAWLINTSRGALVDERALFAALRTGRLAGAALDVFDREPYLPADADSDLRRLPNVVLAPHVGSNTVDANRRMAERALRNIVLRESGDLDAMDLLNPDVRA